MVIPEVVITFYTFHGISQFLNIYSTLFPSECRSAMDFHAFPLLFKPSTRICNNLEIRCAASYDLATPTERSRVHPTLLLFCEGLLPGGRIIFRRLGSPPSTFENVRHTFVTRILTYEPICYTTPSCFPCLLYTSPSPRDGLLSRMPSSA